MYTPGSKSKIQLLSWTTKVYFPPCLFTTLSFSRSYVLDAKTALLLRIRDALSEDEMQVICPWNDPTLSTGKQLLASHLKRLQHNDFKNNGRGSKKTPLLAGL